MTKTFMLDAVERIVWTFVEVFLSMLVMSGTLSISTAKQAGIAGLAAALTLVKALGAKLIGSPDSASTLPVVQPGQ